MHSARTGWDRFISAWIFLGLSFLVAQTAKASDSPQIIYRTDDSGLSDGEVGAVAFASFVGLALLAGTFFYCFFHRKRGVLDEQGLQLTHQDSEAPKEVC